MTCQPIYDSRDARYKTPYGAVAAGTVVQFTLRPPRAAGFSRASLEARFESRNDETLTLSMPWAGMELGQDLFRALRRHRAEPLEAAAGVTFSHPEESALFAAVLSLPAKERVAVHLHYYEGYSQEEIAALLKISPSAVSMRLHRARKHLKSALKEEYDYETAVPEHL